jgi:hypothetical protein
MGVSSLTQYPYSRTFSLNRLLLGITMAPQRPRTIAYLRVSTSEQDVAKNQADILILANRKHLGHVQFVEETVSSRVPWRRRKIAQVLDTLHPGDTLVVSELSRLGRSMLECMEIIAIARHCSKDPGFNMDMASDHFYTTGSNHFSRGANDVWTR